MRPFVAGLDDNDDAREVCGGDGDGDVGEGDGRNHPFPNYSVKMNGIGCRLDWSGRDW